MVSNSQIRIKIKIITILSLIFCFSLLSGSLKITPSSLLRKISKINNDWISTIKVNANVDILNNNEILELLDSSNISNSFTEAEDLSMQETDTEYIIYGKIPANKLSDQIDSSELVDVTYYFNKKDLTFIKMDANLDNKLNNTITQEIAQMVADNKEIELEQAYNNIDVNSNSLISIEVDNMYTKKELKEDLIEKLNLENISTSILKNININGIIFVLGEEITLDLEEVQTNTINTIVIDNITYKIENINDKNILRGINFSWEQGSYSGMTSTEEIIEKYGEPIKVGKKYFWDVKTLNEELTIVSSDTNIELYLK